MLKRILFGLVALGVGVLAIALFIGIGEGSGSGIAAFAALAVLFALLAYVLARFDPPAWWAYTILVCAPVTLLSLSGPGGDYALGALATIGVALIAARFGAIAKRPPPSP